MTAITAIALLIVGFYVLIKGADFLIDGSAAVAKRFGVSPLVIGITIVGFGTSTPELITSIIASAQDESTLVLGNVIGSNIANVALILGVSAMITPLAIKSETVRRELPFTVATSLAMLILIYDSFLNNSANFFSRGDALILLVFLSFFIYFTVITVIGQRKKKSQHLKPQIEEALDEREEASPVFIKKPGTLIALGLIGVVGGGVLVVNNAVTLAELMGLSTTFIGLTVIALGTSLPELVTSVVAALKKETDVAIGNIVGSNIFNLLAILAVAGIISPFPIEGGTIIDATIMTAIMALLLIFGFSRKQITRFEGTILLIAYIATMGFVIYREVNGIEMLV